MTKHFLVALVVCAVATTASAQLMTMTQSTNNTTVVAGSVACANTGTNITVQNDYWRNYNLTTQGVFAPIFFWGADIGIEDVNTTMSGAGSHPATLTIYEDPTPGDITADISNLVVLASETFFIPDQVLSIANLRFTQPFPAFTPNGVSDIVINLDTPSQGDTFFIGSNALGQSQPCYLSSASCGITLPTDTAAITAGMMIIMDIVFDPTNNVPAIGRVGTGEDLSLLTGVAGATPDQTDAKVASATNNDTLQTRLVSPGGGFFTSNYFIIASVGLQANSMGFTQVFPGLWLPIDPSAGLGDFSGGLNNAGGVNVRPILGSGVSTVVILPTLLAGAEVGLQGFCDTTTALNGIFASTRHHIITVN